jgi:hypothetical protein
MIRVMTTRAAFLMGVTLFVSACGTAGFAASKRHGSPQDPTPADGPEAPETPNEPEAPDEPQAEPVYQWKTLRSGRFTVTFPLADESDLAGAAVTTGQELGMTLHLVNRTFGLVDEGGALRTFNFGFYDETDCAASLRHLRDFAVAADAQLQTFTDADTGRSFAYFVADKQTRLFSQSQLNGRVRDPGSNKCILFNAAHSVNNPQPFRGFDPTEASTFSEILLSTIFSLRVAQ